MTKPLDKDAIAKAMQQAAWVAVHGTREEQAGKFMPERYRDAKVEAAPAKARRF